MADKPSIHEDFDRKDEIKVGSEKAFGLVFAAVFAVIGMWPLMDGSEVRVWALVTAGLFGFAALATPKILRPLNQVWFRFGLLLHHIINPLVMALLFFTTVTPMALIMRVMGKDPLRRKFDPAADSYWISRQPAGPAPETMKNQF